MRADKTDYNHSRVGFAVGLIVLLTMVAALFAFVLIQRTHRGGTNDLGKPSASLEQRVFAVA